MRRQAGVVKLADKRTGWYGEGCWRAAGRRFMKRLEHRHNRHFWNALTLKEARWNRELV